ncbi:MAG: hypothetical protein AAGL69_15880 [Pseudomonadota bacterium]
MPDHFGSGAQAPGSDGPRALMAVLRPTTDLAVEGALVAMPGADRVVFGGAIDQLTAGRYRLATASSGGCADPKPTETVGEFDATDFGQGKFSIPGPLAENVASLNQRTVVVLGPLGGEATSPVVVACGVFEVYPG